MLYYIQDMPNKTESVPENINNKEEEIKSSSNFSAFKKLGRGFKKKLGASLLAGAAIAGTPAGAETAKSSGPSREEARLTEIAPEQQAGFSENDLKNLRELQGRVETGKATESEIVAYKELVVRAMEQARDIDPLGNDWSSHRESFGSGEANYWVDQLGSLRTESSGNLAVIQDALDRYYTQSPDGTSERWGNGWLSKFVASELAIRAHELRDKLSEEQKSKLYDVLADTVREETFKLDSKCGIEPGNSCSEDFISFLALISRVKNLYPEVVNRVGVDYLNKLEQKYLHLAFSGENGPYSLVRETTEDGAHILMLNHGEQSAVYSGLLLIYLNHAIQAYSLAGKQVPNFYRDQWLKDGIRDMFSWLQSVSTSDGSSFLNACRSIDGSLRSCADIKITNAIPQVIPAGRLMANLVKSGLFKEEEIFPPDKYQYHLFDSNYSAGNMGNRGRQADFNLDNGEFDIVWEGTHKIRRHLRPVGGGENP
jgi:hypothetical protein